MNWISGEAESSSNAARSARTNAPLAGVRPTTVAPIEARVCSHSELIESPRIWMRKYCCLPVAMPDSEPVSSAGMASPWPIRKLPTWVSRTSSGRSSPRTSTLP